MTDELRWAAPGSAMPDARATTTAAPPVSAPPRSASAPGSWTPPPRAGLVPLRPMTLGTIMSGAFQTLRRNPAATLAPALVLSLIVAVIRALGSAGFLTQYFGAISDATDTSFDSSASSLTSGLLGFVLTTLGSSVLSLIATALVAGVVTVQVGGSTLGTRLRLSTLWRHLRGRRGALVGWAALSGGAVIVVIAVIGGAALALGLAGPAGVAGAVLLAVVLGIGLVVVAAWLWVKLGFVPAILVLERAGIVASMKRSWRLTRGAFWRVFGIRALVLVMVSIATQIIVTPISLVIDLGGGVLAPNGATDEGMSSTLIGSLIATQAVTAVIGAVGLVLSTATTALLYLDQRMRLEGLDLDLARWVERRQAGERGMPDPYLADSIPSGPGGAA